MHAYCQCQPALIPRTCTRRVGSDRNNDIEGKKTTRVVCWNTPHVQTSAMQSRSNLLHPSLHAWKYQAFHFSGLMRNLHNGFETWRWNKCLIFHLSKNADHVFCSKRCNHQNHHYHHSALAGPATLACMMLPFARGSEVVVTPSTVTAARS